MYGSIRSSSCLDFLLRLDFQVLDKMGTIILGLQSGEDHLGSRNVFLGVEKIFKQRLAGPGDSLKTTNKVFEKWPEVLPMSHLTIVLV